MDGTPFGRYRLVDLLGRGGMGEVWRAFDTVTERVVAVKVLPAHLADDQGFQERFRREAKAAASLREPHVVPIHDLGEIDGQLFVSMRLVDGYDLQTLLAHGPLAPDQAVTIIEQIASALHAAHRIGLIHRDVKPSNILVAEDDFAYLIDFGIARVVGETGLTSTGVTVGTWPYMAPERFRTGAVDARADVYSLACVLHQALTGQPPFPSESLEQIAAGHMFEPPPRPSAFRNGIPAEMDDVIATGMAKDPVDRFPTTKDLAHAARAALATPSSRGPCPVPSAGASADIRDFQRPSRGHIPIPANHLGPTGTGMPATPAAGIRSTPTQYAPINPALAYPASPVANQPRVGVGRPAVVTAAVAIGLLCAVVPAFLGAISVAEGLAKHDVAYHLMGALFLAMAAVLIWGAVGALRGITSKGLRLPPLVIAGLMVLMIAAALTAGSLTVLETIPLLVLSVLLTLSSVLVRMKSSQQFFAHRPPRMINGPGQGRPRPWTDRWTQGGPGDQA